MSEHSRLSPSSIDRIIKCPGSAVHNPPDRGSAAANQGTFAHSLGERILRGEAVEDSEYEDNEMKSAVFEYVAYVKSHKSHDELAGVERLNSRLSVEERIVSSLVPDHGGTLDALIVSDSHIHVNDFKYGVWPVSPYDNKQLLSYLILAAEKYPGRKRFFGSIIQPRVFGETECVEYSQEKLDCHSFDVIMAEGDDHRVAGDHCKWCPLKPTCSVLDDRLKKVAVSVVDASWTGEQCKEVIVMGSVVINFVSEAKLQLTKLLKDGRTVDGWKLVHNLGNRAWIDDDITVAAFSDKGLNDEVIYNKKLKSPAQMEKFSKAYKPLVSTLCHRPDKGVVAVESDSSLPEYDPASVFEDLS